MASFDSLVRFLGEDGNVYYGEAGVSSKHTKESLTGCLVPIFQGVEPWGSDFVLTGEHRKVAEVVTLGELPDKLFRRCPNAANSMSMQVLCPLPATPIFMCVGLNYKQHAEEAKMSYGEYPVIFAKPADALAGPFEDVTVPSACISMDYEAELCVVIGKDCKNLTADSDLSEYILGYAVGNDVSSRWWQMPERSGNQHGIAKSFDKFGPVGPVITSPKVIRNPADLVLECFVNGERRQSTKIDDMIFDVPAILEHLSRGTTLRKGTIIMTGTPSGVAAFMKPPGWLKDGDIVEVHLSKVGAIRNKMVFEANAK